jgi:hypothetical protein
MNVREPNPPEVVGEVARCVVSMASRLAPLKLMLRTSAVKPENVIWVPVPMSIAMV